MRVSCILGTRPEAIKLAPVIRALAAHPRFVCQVCLTAQHREMLDQVLEAFAIVPDHDLALMEPDQSLPSLTARAITAIDGYLAGSRPDLVVVQGDTTTVFCAALAAFYRRVPVAHVEAGLRTGDRHAPYPEEMNRVLVSHLTDLHFAPTETARSNLVAEGIAAEQVFVTGNTVVDALGLAVERVRVAPPDIPGLPVELMGVDRQRPLVLVTGHRRESFGAGFESICRAIARLAERFPKVVFVYPVHLNPRVREPVFRLLSGCRNVFLIDPVGYLPFVALMDRARLILTDSGGIQEEAPSLGRPVLVMREVTERPEGVAAGVSRLVGTDAERIEAGVAELLSDDRAYRRMAQAVNPYGDGQAAARIVRVLVEHEPARR